MRASVDELRSQNLPHLAEVRVDDRRMILLVGSAPGVELDNNGSVGVSDHGRASGLFAVLCADVGDRVTAATVGGVVAEITQRCGGTFVADVEPSRHMASMFALASDAMRAALEIAATLGIRSAVDVAELDGDRSSIEPGIVRCRGLLDAANDGQVLASSAAMDVARSAIGGSIEMTDLGVHDVRGRQGRVWIWQLDRTGLRRSFAPLRTRDSMATTLPLPGTSFIGREADVSALAELLESHRVLSIVGAGGCGKTRLAVEVAIEILGRFRGGAVWVDLAPLTEPSAVFGAVATAVGLHTPGEITAERIAAHVGERSLLILVDNCEHVVATTARLVAALTASCASVRILATSREPLALTHESVWRIPSLGVPQCEGGDDLLDSDAGRLLVERIRLVRPTFEPDSDEARALADVCRRLDGIPLALELAAARTSTISPIELAGVLDQRFRLLGGGTRDSIARQRTLEASVAWSYQLLTADEQRCFRRLSVFAGSFSLDAAVRMCSGALPDPEDSIVRLVDCSLLVERTGAGPRLQMLEPIRWFARERLIDSDDADDVLGQLLAWAVDTARTLGGQLEGPARDRVPRTARRGRRQSPRRWTGRATTGDSRKRSASSRRRRGIGSGGADSSRWSTGSVDRESTMFASNLTTGSASCGPGPS